MNKITKDQYDNFASAMALWEASLVHNAYTFAKVIEPTAEAKVVPCELGWCSMFLNPANPKNS